MRELNSAGIALARRFAQFGRTATRFQAPKCLAVNAASGLVHLGGIVGLICPPARICGRIQPKGWAMVASNLRGTSRSSWDGPGPFAIAFGGRLPGSASREAPSSGIATIGTSLASPRKHPSAETRLFACCHHIIAAGEFPFRPGSPRHRASRRAALGHLQRTLSSLA
jgi:hypothetical protein